jgi:hypothetical protein
LSIDPGFYLSDNVISSRWDRDTEIEGRKAEEMDQIKTSSMRACLLLGSKAR